VKKKEDNG